MLSRSQSSNSYGTKPQFPKIHAVNYSKFTEPSVVADKYAQAVN